MPSITRQEKTFRDKFILDRVNFMAKKIPKGNGKHRDKEEQFPNHKRFHLPERYKIQQSLKRCKFKLLKKRYFKTTVDFNKLLPKLC